MKHKLIGALVVALSLCIVEILFIPVAAHASTHPGAAPPDTHPLTKQIEWSHPMNLATLLKNGPAHLSAAAHPNAGPGILTVCTGPFYYVSYGGRDYWQTTWHNLVLRVNYVYCPGGTFGYNFAYGQAYTTSGDTYGVEYGGNWNYQWDGASLHSPNGTYVNDGQGYTGIYVGGGIGAADYSYPGPGNLTWSAQFWIYTCDQSNNNCTTAHVASPTF